MSVKKLINSPESCVEDCLYGLCNSYPGLVLHEAERVVFCGVPNEKRKVAVLSGGGSGHEPFPSGFVGDGMLSASVSGSVFTSPPHRQILYAIKKLSEKYEGVFIVVPNYTGDRLNFGLAIESARKEGISVESVVVGEDVALEGREMENKVGRRGMCGLILLLKICGYLSKEGKTLQEINEIAEILMNNMASIGVGLEPCSLPGSGLLFQLKPDEMELGVGVHGEAGVRKMKLKSARETVNILLTSLAKDLKITEGDEVVALVNNLGSMSQIEQWIVAGEVEKQLTEKRVKVSRIYAGSLFTSLNMAGVQLCLLNLVERYKHLFLTALDDTTTAPAWPGSTPPKTVIYKFPHSEIKQYRSRWLSGGMLMDEEADVLEKCLVEGCNMVIDNEERMNYLDSGCGDGDCGTTVSRFAKEILEGISEKRFKMSHPAQLLHDLGEIADETMGGTSGAIYGLFLMGVSNELSSSDVVNGKVWSKAWVGGIKLVKKYSLARRGDRTLLDALETGCESFSKALETSGADSAVTAFATAVESAEEGCAKTKYMKAVVGRASYVEESRLKDVDAGAFGVTIWLKAFLKILKGSASS